MNSCSMDCRVPVHSPMVRGNSLKDFLRGTFSRNSTPRERAKVAASNTIAVIKTGWSMADRNDGGLSGICSTAGDMIRFSLYNGLCSRLSLSADLPQDPHFQQ